MAVQPNMPIFAYSFYNNDNKHLAIYK